MGKKDKFDKILNRRNFLRNTVIASAGTVLLPSVLTSCDYGIIPDPIDGGGDEPDRGFGFFEGVASFDPETDRVVLWSRYTLGENDQGANIILDVAVDSGFRTIVASEEVEVDVESDYTIIVDLENLEAGTQYYYKFRCEESGAVSVIGITQTLPESVDEVKLAVVSCANYQAGLFNVYGAVAESDADIVVHLGDYIYEYPAGGYGTDDNDVDTDALGRLHRPSGEIITLDDYRTRYRQYRSDKQLQEAHRVKPFICVWDDHEITNDAYKDGAENHNDGEGSYEDRKAAAFQAWHEYLPARLVSGATNSEIYRNFEIGGLINLIMMDTRVVGRDKQLDYTDFLDTRGSAPVFNEEAFQEAWLDPQRTILGQKQKTWVQGQLSSSSAKWQILGSQVLMARYWMPVEVLLLQTRLLDSNPLVAAAAVVELIATIKQLVAIKRRILEGDQTVTAEEAARVNNRLPYNLDAWDGYPVERDAILNTAAQSGKKLVSIAGDTHNGWYAKHVIGNGETRVIGDEFATASVSSPGFEGFVPAGQLDNLATSVELLVDELQYMEPAKKGFLMLSVTQSAATAEWSFVEQLAIESTESTVENTVIV